MFPLVKAALGDDRASNEMVADENARERREIRSQLNQLISAERPNAVRFFLRLYLFLSV